MEPGFAPGRWFAGRLNRMRLACMVARMRIRHLRNALILLTLAGALFLDVARPWSRGREPAPEEWRIYWLAMAQGDLPACAAAGNRHCLAVPHF